MPEIGGDDLRGEDRAGDGDESSVDLRVTVRGRDDGAGGQKGDDGAGGDVAVFGRGSQLGESLEDSVNHILSSQLRVPGNHLP